MTIQVTEPGSPAFYKEMVNFGAQFADLLKKPAAKVKNKYAQCVRSLVLSAVLLALGLTTGFLWGFDALNYLLIFISALLLFCGAFLLLSYGKARRKLMTEWQPSALTLDDAGVSLVRGDSTIATAWENVAFVRELRHGICFVAKEPMHYYIFLNKEYADGVLSYLRQNRPEVMLVTE